MKQLCIIAPTASGKSALAIEIAKEFNANIFSIDSLSIYKEIDIASAKPSKRELQEVRHYGIDIYMPYESCDVTKVIDMYKSAKEESMEHGKNLIIVGGSLFFLKSMIDGLSDSTKASPKIKELIKREFPTPQIAYEFLRSIDNIYAQRIDKNDSFRINRGLEIYLQTGLRASDFFRLHPKRGVLDAVRLYEIVTPREVLLERIAKRTKEMLNAGLIDEVCYLEHAYGRDNYFSKAIGIKEVLDFLDTKIKKTELFEKIATSTAQYAKRQTTFAKTQFIGAFKGSLEESRENIRLFLKNY